MPLTVEFTIDESQFFLGQDPKCKISLKNTGDKEISLIHPATSNTMPIWHVFNIETGEAAAHQGKDSIFRDVGLLELEPDETFEKEFRLMKKAPLTLPGQYDISVEFVWNEGAFSTTSDPVRVTVNPLLARNLAIASLNGGICARSVMTWLRPKDDKWQFMIAGADTMKTPEISGIAELKEVAKPVNPVLAVPKNQSFASKTWIAWFDQGTLSGFRVSGRPGSFQLDRATIHPPTLPAHQTSIFGPLLPVPELGSAGEAAAAVLCQTSDDGKSNLQIAIIDKNGEVSEGPFTKIHGGPASWGQGVALTSGERRIFVAANQTDEKGSSVTLQEVAWPLKAAEVEHIGQAKFEGVFLSGAMSVNEDDLIHGGVLVLSSPPEGEPHLMLHPFSHAANGRLEMADPISITADPVPTVRESRMAVNAIGKIFGLLRDGSGQWLAYSSFGEKLDEVPDPSELMTGALDIVLGGDPDDQYATIIFSAPGLSFRFALSDGGPASPGPLPTPPA